ncbi:hypothetical protein ES705_05587 [subsurface metagenome]
MLIIYISTKIGYIHNSLKKGDNKNMSFYDTGWAWPWWSIMVAINIVSLVVCAIVIYKQSRIPKDETNTNYRNWMLIMGIIFTVVGLYRAVFVSRYGPQRAWFDTLANSTLLIRSLATFAELAFSGLIALAMLKFNTYIPPKEGALSNKFKSFYLTKGPYILPICIFLANIFATSSVITKFGLLGVIEETFWSIGFIAILPLAIIQLRRVFLIKDKKAAARLRMLKISAIVIAAWSMIYVGYGLIFHLPGMWQWVIQTSQTGWPAFKTGWSAIVDAFMIVNVSRLAIDYSSGFLIWHSAYFSICVWISIFLMQAPRPQENPKKLNPKLTIITLTSMALVIIALLTIIIIRG